MGRVVVVTSSRGSPSGDVVDVVDVVVVEVVVVTAGVVVVGVLIVVVVVVVEVVGDTRSSNRSR